MSVNWVKDVDSGELFPAVDDECFDIPEHLKDADYNEVDYDRTIKYTIEQLQNQLLVAQNHIESIQRNSDVSASSYVPVEPPAEVAKLRFDIKSIIFSWEFFIGLAMVLMLAASIFAFEYLSDNGIIELRTNENIQSLIETNSKVSFSPVPVYGKIPAYTDGNGMYYYIDYDSSDNNKSSISDTNTSEDTEAETENNPFLNLAFRLLALLIPIIGIRFSIKFMMNAIRSC